MSLVQIIEEMIETKKEELNSTRDYNDADHIQSYCEGLQDVIDKIKEL